MSRILIATILGLAGFFAYVVGVVTLADHLYGWPWLVQPIYFVLAGILWVFPARRLILWSVHQ